MARLKEGSLVQTCAACPSQWEAHLEDGRMVYVRFRWGGLAISVSEGPTNDVFDAVKGPDILYRELSDSLDGHLTTENMLPYLDAALAVI